MNLERALKEVQLWWKDENLADRTIGNYTRAVRRIDREVNLLSDHPQLEQWRETQQRRFRAGKVSASHINVDRSALLSFYAGLVARGHLESNPAKSLKALPLPSSLPRPIPIADQEKMLRLPDLTTFGGLRDRAVLECMRHGMRQGEVAGLRISGVSYDEREESLFLEFGAKGRNRKRRTRDVPLEHGSAILVAWYVMERFAPKKWPKWLGKGTPYEQHMAALQKLLHQTRTRDDIVLITDTGHKLYQAWVSRMFAHYRTLAQVDPKFTPHTFRHRFCTSLLENNVDTRISMRLTGHEDIRSLMRYTQVARTGAVAGVGAIGTTPEVVMSRTQKRLRSYWLKKGDILLGSTS